MVFESRPLIQTRELPDIGRWKDPASALGEVMAHPRFGEASRALATGMLALSARDRALDSLFKDAGRYVAAMCAFHLHTEGELTLPRLKDLCGGSGLLSPGRARSLLHVLEHLGYVEALARGGGGAASVYAATPAFEAGWEAQFRVALEAARVIDPAVDALLDGLHEPRILRTFARLHTQGLVTSAAGGDGFVLPVVSAFLHHHAGMQVMWVLIEGSEDGAFPPRRAGPITLAALARRFGVSRIHLKRIFEDGAAANLSRLNPDGVVTLTPGAREQLAILYGVQFAQLLSAAAGVAAAQDEASMLAA